jgi:poly-beta-1,6-N-acetyl-D-glucosamine synthase
MFELVLFGLLALGLGLGVYGAYFFLVLKNKKAIASFKTTLSALQSRDVDLKPVSIIVNTFNEAKVIERKLANVSKLNYPLDKLEVLVIDDDSSDGTSAIAEKTLGNLGLSGRVIRNPKRIGLNRSLNIAMNQASYNYVCVTDSDVMLDSNALRNSVSVLMGFENVGGVTGKIEPIFHGAGIAQSNESAYRNFYDNSMLGEAALHSAFPGNGPLIVFDKSLVPTAIPVDYGSTDGNIAMNIINSGHRFVYVPNAVIFEPVPENLGQQRLQKVRRAQRLIQVFLHNRSLFLNGSFGKFGRIIFPLKFSMMILCPLLLVFGLGFFAIGVALSSNFFFQVTSLGGLFIGVTALSYKGLGRMLYSFVFHQLYLLAGLLVSLRKSVYWKTIDRQKFESR